MPDVYLKYVGRKDWTVDSITGSGVTWNGHGDIQPVPEKSAERLLKHPDQWELVSVREALTVAQTKPVAPKTVEIEPFDDDGLGDVSPATDASKTKAGKRVSK